MTQAIFLSYSSDDADAARRICDALRAAGLEVWFDQSELRGGDAWDASIRKQIKECALFVPMISASTNARSEGYFRLEWKLAVDRSHLMADDQTFFLPVILDDTSEPAARVPDRFRERQWSRLNDDTAVADFAAQLVKLIAGSGVSGRSATNTTPNGDLVDSVGGAKRSVPPNPDAAAAMSTNPPSEARGHAAPAWSPPPPYAASPSDATPSIAVLAFANRSASADDEYFSDGLADELLNVLAKIKGLRVAARTSAFSFKGKPSTVAEIGRALNVATVLEGSVRKSGNRARISVQLIKVSDGYHLWSETYDRTLDDIFAVQDEIAEEVVTALRTTLLGQRGLAGNVTAEVASATQNRSENSEAHRLIMQARYLMDRHSGAELLQGITYLREALAADPHYALAWAHLSRALTHAGAYGYAEVFESNTEALAAAQHALQLAPNLAEGHLAMCMHEVIYGWDWQAAKRHITRGLALAPDNAEILAAAGLLSYTLGQSAASIAYYERALQSDPLNSRLYLDYSRPLNADLRFADAERACRRALALSPDGVPYRYMLAEALALQGRVDEAIAEVSMEKADWARHWGLSVFHAMRGQVAESDLALCTLLEHNAHHSAAQISAIYAMRGDADAAFHWLERAYAQRDSGVTHMKLFWQFQRLNTDPRWKPLLKKMRLDN